MEIADSSGKEAESLNLIAMRASAMWPGEESNVARNNKSEHN